MYKIDESTSWLDSVLNIRCEAKIKCCQNLMVACRLLFIRFLKCLL